MKLMANWLNGMSITLVGAGIFIPVINQTIGNNPVSPVNFALLLVACLLIALSLHLAGQKILRGLHEPDGK